VIVVKLGGSLNRDPLLRDWLELLSTSGGGHVVVVSGGGGFADQVREHQLHWQFDDLAAHNMAILAMMQSATMFRSLAPGLEAATTSLDIARVLRAGGVAVWYPADWIRTQANDMTHWGATSDSLAAWLATHIGASTLVLVKAADIRPAVDLAGHARSGMVDAEFCRLTGSASYSIEVLGKTELSRLGNLLDRLTSGFSSSSSSSSGPGSDRGPDAH